MGKVNELEMENKVYKEELNDLKEENEIFLYINYRHYRSLFTL